MTTLAEFNKQEMNDMLRRAKTMSTAQLQKEVPTRTRAVLTISCHLFVLFLFIVSFMSSQVNMIWILADVTVSSHGVSSRCMFTCFTSK